MVKPKLEDVGSRKDNLESSKEVTQSNLFTLDTLLSRAV